MSIKYLNNINNIEIETQVKGFFQKNLIKLSQRSKEMKNHYDYLNSS